MVNTEQEMLDDQCNPLDSAEDFLNIQKWRFDRLSEEQLYLHVEGDRGNYKLLFMWDEMENALQLCCEIDLCMPKSRTSEMHKMLAEINSQMWLGHFDLSSDKVTECVAPCFRYNTFIRGMDHVHCHHLIKDLVKFTLQECERLHDAFQVLDKSNDQLSHLDSADSIELALAQTVGQC